MLLLVGLGNPGRDYARNRHNVGFMAVDAIVHRHDLPAFRARFQGLALVSEGVVAGEKVLVLKPTAYMNNSGQAVAAAAHFYKIPPDRIVVFHDELDLKAGKLRVKRGGGAAGHNGIRSIDAHIGADYRRVRIGVGHPGDSDRVLAHVLNDFGKDDAEWLDKLLEAQSVALPDLIAGNDAAFMSRVAGVMTPPKPKTKPAPPESSSNDRTEGSGRGV